MSDTRAPEQLSLPLDIVNSTAGDNEAAARCISYTGEQVRTAHPMTSLDSRCTIHPETLGTSTPMDFEFRYLDISAVTKGRIDWSATRICKFADAPSRARRRLRSGDVLLCTVRPGLQAHARIQGDEPLPVVASTGFALLRPNVSTDSGFTFHQLFSNGVAAQLSALETGSSYPAVNEGDVRRILVFAPEVEERKHIAAVLDTVDEAIAKTEAVIAKLKQVCAGLLHDLLTRGLDEHGQLRDPIAYPEQFQDSPLGRIPKAWSIQNLDDSVRIIDCKHYTPKFVKEGKAFIRPRNVKPEGLDFSDVDFVSDEDFILLTDKHIPRIGDIIFSRNATFGVACYVDQPIPIAIGQDTVVMTHKLASTHFIYYVLCSHLLEAQIMRVSSGSTFGRINLAFIRSLLVPNPALEEQNAIVEKMIAFDRQVKIEEAQLTKLAKLKSGLMTDLLTGRVRVPEGIVVAS